MGVSHSQRTSTISYIHTSRNVRAKTETKLLEGKDEVFGGRDHEENINSLPQDSNIRQMDRFGLSKMNHPGPCHKSKNPYAHEHGTLNEYYMVAEKRYKKY